MVPYGRAWALFDRKLFPKSYEEKQAVLSRVMRESASRFNHQTTATAYIQRYEEMLGQKVGD